MKAPLALVGFDSAWTDNPKKPGAICGLTLSVDGSDTFFPPRPATFSTALEFIRMLALGADCTIVAIDQPTIVPNATGFRPVERVAASMVSWLGGGVQPSYRERYGMFDESAPIWKFLTRLGALENPSAVRLARSGLHIAEVFPAIALPSLDPDFYGRLKAPRYNPQRKKTYRQGSWEKVVTVVARELDALSIESAASWCRENLSARSPRKADQDALDSVICLLVAARWRLGEPSLTGMLGDLETGYMVLPMSTKVREHLAVIALGRSVPFKEMT